MTQGAHAEADGVAGRVPPHDHETEAAVLSGIMLRPDGAAAVDEIRPLVDAADFYSEAHRRICEACFALAAEGKPTDIISVQGWLKDKQRLAQIGGTGYLTEILDSAPFVGPEHLAVYARRVRAKARQRRLAYKLQTHLARCYAPATDDELAALFDAVETDFADICAEGHARTVQKLGAVVGRAVTSFTEAEDKAKQGKVVGVSTGFDRFDAITNGLHGGDLTIVAARPGMGKTAFVTAALEGIAKTTTTVKVDGKDVEVPCVGVLFSNEMPSVQIGARMICSSAWLNLQVARAGKLTPANWSSVMQTASALSDLDIYIDDTPGITLAEARAKIRRLAAQAKREGKKLVAAIFDFLQILNLEQERGETRDNAIGRMTSGMKRLAMEFDVAVVALSQLNRALETRDNKRPTKSDLRDSGNIEQDADNIIMVYRDDYYTKDKSNEPGIAELIIEKQRNGPTGTVRVGFKKESARFYNLPNRGDEDDRQPLLREAPRMPEPPIGRFDDTENFFTEGMSR